MAVVVVAVVVVAVVVVAVVMVAGDAVVAAVAGDAVVVGCWLLLVMLWLLVVARVIVGCVCVRARVVVPLRRMRADTT